MISSEFDDEEPPTRPETPRAIATTRPPRATESEDAEAFERAIAAVGEPEARWARLMALLEGKEKRDGKG